jgi:competence protein ComFB
MELHNLMEYEVKYTLNHILETTEDVKCSCEHCKLDIMAIALNSLPPKYIVTEKGLLYSRIPNFNQQFNADVVAAIAKGIKVVNENPRHE